MKRGKMLGGKPPRRGGKLVGQPRDRASAKETPSHLVLALVLATLVLGMVAGFIWALDRQLRGGLMAQEQEARQRPDWVSLDGLGPAVPTAFLLAVDPNFPNRGTSYRADRWSLPRDLVRQVHMLGSGLPGRARERMMAPLIEFHYTPAEIVELYINRVYLGRDEDVRIYGVYHAAREYTGKDPSDLTLGEAAALAGLLLHPRLEMPDRVPGAVGARRNEILAALYAEGAITAEELASARAEPLPFQPGLDELPVSRRIPSASDTVPIRFTAEPPRPD